MQVFLEMIASQQIDMSGLTTHRFSITQAEQAYQLISNPRNEFIVGVMLTYGDTSSTLHREKPLASKTIAKNKTDTLELGIIGTGNFARGVLLPAFLATKQFSVRGVASAKGLSAQSVCNRYHGQYAVSDSSTIIADPKINAVVIATRHDSHAKLVVAALQQGKHVFVEKPLCLTEEELIQIEQAALQSRGILMVGFNRRFSPYITTICQHVAARTEPLAMIYRINAGRIPLVGESAWLHDPSIGGGRIIGEACHFVDTLTAICGARPVQVSAINVNPKRMDLAQTDNVTMTVRFDDGSIGTIHYFANGDASYPKERLEVFGEGKIAILENFRELTLVSNNNSKKMKTRGQEKGYRQEANAFAKACRVGESPIDLSSLLETTRVTFCVMEELVGG